jgi:arylformamidase
MGLIDISPPLRVGMGVFPGDAAFQTAQTFTIGPNCPVNVAEIAMSTHCGAHADAPLHYDPNGASIDTLDLSDFIGPARVVDARGENALCGFEEIAAALDGAPPRLLFRLMDRLDPMVWPTLSRAGAGGGRASGASRCAPDRRRCALDRSGDVEGASFAHGLPGA